MKKICVLFLGLMVGAASAQARAGGKGTARTPTAVAYLTFAEFEKLDGADQSEHLENLRKLALAVEAAGGTPMFSWLDKKSWRSLGHMLQGSEAWAQSGSCGAGQKQCPAVLYGYGPDDKGICARDSGRFLVACDAIYRKIPNYGGAEIARQLKSKGLDKDFDKQSADVSAFCSQEGADKQKRLCDYVKDRVGYLKRKVSRASTTPKKEEAKKEEPKKEEPKKEEPKKEEPKKQEAKGNRDKPKGARAIEPKGSTAAPPSAPTPPPPAAAPKGGKKAAGADASAGQDGAPGKPGASDAKPGGDDKKAAAEKKEEKAELGADGCLKSTKDIKAAGNLLPQELRALADPSKKICLMSAGAKTDFGTFEMPAAAILSMSDQGGLHLNMAAQPPSISGEPPSHDEGYVSKACLTLPKKKGKFDEAEEMQLTLRSGTKMRIQFFDGGMAIVDKRGSLLLKYSSQMGACKSQIAQIGALVHGTVTAQGAAASGRDGVL